MNIRIQAIHFDADQKLVDFIEKKTQKLLRFFTRIQEIEVYLKLGTTDSQINEKIVELKVRVPGHTLFAEEHSTTFEKAVDEAVESIRRQLKKHKEKQKK
ncbi:MAG: hypothetical protein KatS3mg031_1745 [Chitinophagales bacterium]|nr:MAG: hypothetical protein KatS3mg031_1745 [Chitinophagales bacterium]